MNAPLPPRWWRGLLAAFAPLRQRWMLVDGAWSSVPSEPPDAAADSAPAAHTARPAQPPTRQEAA